MKLSISDLNTVISRDKRQQLEFEQRNILLNFFMNKSTYDLQQHLINIAERHEGDCLNEELGYCSVCTFVDHYPDIITLIPLWCNCGHKFVEHTTVIKPQRCVICECKGYIELKNQTDRMSYSFRANSLNCKKCGTLNLEVVLKEKGESYLCHNCI